MKKTLVSLLAALALCSATAQTANGGIDAKMLEKIKSGYTNSPEQRAIKNALASNSIASLSINGDNLAKCDNHFSHRVKTRGITDQKSSGVVAGIMLQPVLPGTLYKIIGRLVFFAIVPK